MDQLDDLTDKLEQINERIKESSSKEDIEQLKQDQNQCLEDISNITKRIDEYSDQINLNITHLGAPAYDNPQATTAMGAMMGVGGSQHSTVEPETSSKKPGFFSKLFSRGKTKKNSDEPSSPGFFSRMKKKLTRKNKVSPTTEGSQDPATASPTATEAEQHNSSVLEQENKAGLTRVPGETLKSRFSKGLSNVGNSLRQGLGNLKQKFTRKNIKEAPINKEGEDTNASPETPTPTPDSKPKTWRDNFKLPKLPNFLTRKKKK